MLIAALTALYLYFSFGSHDAAPLQQFEQTEQLIQKNVADQARREQALAIVDQMKAATRASVAKQAKFADSVNAIIAKRETSTSEIERATLPLFGEADSARAQLLDLRLRLKSALTASEWALVFPTSSPTPPGAKKAA